MSTRARRSASTTTPGGIAGTPGPVKNVTAEPIALEEITEEKAKLMAVDAVDWALCHGLAMRPAENLSDDAAIVELTPVTLLPDKFDADIFAEAMAIQKDLNLLYFNIGNDFEFLKSSLKEVIKGDEFTRRLFTILEKVHSEGLTQPLSLNVMRADYMLHKLPSSTVPTAQPTAGDTPTSTGKTPRSKKAKLEKVPDTFLKQVEVNTIAASFGGLSPKVQGLHKFVLQSMLGFPETQLRHSLPENNSVQLVAEGIVNGWREYNDNQAVVLFVVENQTRNINDQRLLEYEVFAQSGGMIKTVRMSLEQIANQCHWDEAGKILTWPESNVEKMKQNGPKVEKEEKSAVKETEAIEMKSKEESSEKPVISETADASGKHVNAEAIETETNKIPDEKMEVSDATQHKTEDGVSATTNAHEPEKSAEKISFGRPVAVVYFRAGYVPDHYPTEQEWIARERLERCRAIKCPSIGFHLAGTKKVQQILTQPGAVEPFVKGKRVAERLRAVFTEMFGFDDEGQSEAALNAVKANPGDFVLKPQREGGGNNVYGDEVLKQLETMSTEDRAAHVLMQRIRPPLGRNVILRRREPVKLVDTISELGIFGYALGTKHSIKMNEGGGYIFRTKQAETNEGGIMAGASGLSTPFLTKA